MGVGWRRNERWVPVYFFERDGSVSLRGIFSEPLRSPHFQPNNIKNETQWLVTPEPNTILMEATHSTIQPLVMDYWMYILWRTFVVPVQHKFIQFMQARVAWRQISPEYMQRAGTISHDLARG
jgi:hypothetical protein